MALKRHVQKLMNSSLRIFDHIHLCLFLFCQNHLPDEEAVREELSWDIRFVVSVSLPPPLFLYPPSNNKNALNASRTQGCQSLLAVLGQL